MQSDVSDGEDTPGFRSMIFSAEDGNEIAQYPYVFALLAVKSLKHFGNSLCPSIKLSSSVDLMSEVTVSLPPPLCRSILVSLTCPSI